MHCLTKHLHVTGLLGVVALVFTPPVVLGQVPNWRTGTTQPLNTGAVGGSGVSTINSAAYGAGNGAANGYGGSGYGQNPYGTYYEDPNGAYLRGSGQVIDAQGRFMQNQQQAYLLREQVHAQRLANERKAFEDYLYKRQNTPSPEEESRRLQSQSAQRARSNPSLAEVCSGRALNDILKDLQTHPVNAGLADAHMLPRSLDEDGLRHINVTSGAGNLGLLKNEGRLPWPAGLSGSVSAEQEGAVGALVQRALRQAELDARVETSTIRQLRAGLDQLRAQLRKNARELSAAEYTEAKTFLDNFDDAVTALRQADVGNHMTGQYSLKVRTVEELVKYMTEKGLEFAPAVPGDKEAYMALHQALASYGRPGQTQTAGRLP
jgi:hypothetical protein